MKPFLRTAYPERVLHLSNSITTVDFMKSLPFREITSMLVRMVGQRKRLVERVGDSSPKAMVSRSKGDIDLGVIR
jgi:hypothetical protein